MIRFHSGLRSSRLCAMPTHGMNRLVVISPPMTYVLVSQCALEISRSSRARSASWRAKSMPSPREGLRPISLLGSAEVVVADAVGDDLEDGLHAVVGVGLLEAHARDPRDVLDVRVVRAPGERDLVAHVVVLT